MGRGNNSNRNAQTNKKDEDKAKANTQTGNSSTSVGDNYLPTPKTEPKMVADEDVVPQATDSTPSTNGTVADREQEVSLKPTEEMLRAAEVVATMKDNIAELSKALEAIGSQVVLVTSLHGSMKIHEEVESVRRDLQKQITRQKDEIQKEREHLEKLIKQSLEEGIRERLNSRIRDIVQAEIVKKITEELRQQIPEDFKTQASRHPAQMRRIDIDLHNAEAKRHNANAKKTEQLRPLLIPKAVGMNRSLSGSTSTPSTASGILQTPHDSSLLFSSVSPAVNDDDWSSEWPVTPLSVQILFKMNKDTLRQLLQDLGEDVPVAKDDQQHAEQLNKAISLVGAKYHVVIPPTPVPRRAPPRRQANQNAPDALLSPLMLATL